MSAAKVRNHVRVLRAFASWLYREAYTDENVLNRIEDRPPRLPAAPHPRSAGSTSLAKSSLEVG